MNDIRVSIVCITYNHESYIRDCLDGFFMQKTNFPFEVLIHDDASTDRTVDIIREYEIKYPNIIKPIYQTENQFSKGINPAVKYLYPIAKGKYIAICEGDDYWTDPYKLQKQVDFLETNEDFVLCAHGTRIRHDEDPALDGTLFKDFHANAFCGRYKEVYTIEDALLGNIFHTSSMCFRNIPLNYPKWFSEIPTGDFLLVAFLAAYGRLYVMQDVMSTYRFNSASVTTSSSSPLSSKIKSSLIHIKRDLLLNEYYERKYECILHKPIAKHYLTIMQEYKRQKKYFKSLYCLLKIGRYDKAMFLSQLKTILRKIV